MKKSEDRVAEVLQQCTVEGNVIKLPETQLDRKEYLGVKKALELIGGKWKGGKVFGFVFKENPTELLEQIANGVKRNLKKEFQFFATPSHMAKNLVYLADLKNHDTVLEPSAGQGAIIAHINEYVRPDCFELMEVNRHVLKKTNLLFNLVGEDFLKSDNKTYSKIIANPPFTKNQDIDHVYKMYDKLGRGGRIVTMMSQHWLHSEHKKESQFRSWLNDVDSEIIEIEEGAFKESGTMVATVIVIINKSL